MPIATRNAEIRWEGPLGRGTGTLTSGSNALDLLGFDLQLFLVLEEPRLVLEQALLVRGEPGGEISALTIRSHGVTPGVQRVAGTPATTRAARSRSRFA